MPDELIVGRIDRPVGLAGEVLVRLFTNRVERLDAGARLISDKGDLTVADARPQKDRYAVKFAEIGDRETAEAFGGVELRAEPITDPDELWVHDLLGAELVDQDGVGRGRVIEVIPNPASDLLALDTGALVPVRFVVDLTANETVTVTVPDGLFDLG